MRQVAIDFGVINQFPDEKKFFDVYRILRGFETVTWATSLSMVTDVLSLGFQKHWLMK